MSPHGSLAVDFINTVPRLMGRAAGRGGDSS